jgi:tetratricopeptide (TPR) repeat protein
MADLQQKIVALEKRVGTDGKSPLFAQLASYYVQQGRAQDALHLCDKGLATFPHYTTGHLVKGKALLALKMNAEAKREFELVLNFLPANETVAFILSNIHSEETLVPEPKPAAVKSAPPAPPLAPLKEAQEETTPAETVLPKPEHPPVPPEPANIFEAVGQNPGIVDDPFGFGVQGGPTTTPPAETTTAPPEESANPFEGFPESTNAPAAAATPEEASPGNIFDFPGQESQQGPTPESTEAQTGVESFEDFSVRMRTELGGGENTLTLDEYLSNAQTGQWPTQDEPSGQPSNTIEDLAEKLQSAKKITPIIDLSTRSTTPASESDTPAGTGFVTPTLAEIYAKQGWYDDAIKAYHTLIVTKPAEKDRFEARIAELEELKKQQNP